MGYQSISLAVLLIGLVFGQSSPTTYSLPLSGNLNITNVNEGYIVSTLYPAQYPNNVNSTITITASALKTFTFSASVFDLEMVGSGPSCYDKISFATNRLGVISTSGPYCGSTTAYFPTLTLQGSQVELRFTSDYVAQRNGFRLHFRIYDAPPPTTPTCGVPAITPCLPKPSTNPSCSSGLTRIVGGANALPNSYPWQAMMFKKTATSTKWCGASIIHRNWLITSASCIDDLGYSGLYIRVGSHSLLESRTPFTVQSVYAHPSYVRGSADYNVALLRVNGTILFNSTVSPICIDTSNSDYTGQTVVATGWGSLDSIGRWLPINLQEVELRVSSAYTCTSAYGSNVTPRILCATEFGKGICYGDVGGPLVRRDSTGRFYLLGVSNTWSASGCVTYGKPSLFTKVSAISGWISSYVV